MSKLVPEVNPANEVPFTVTWATAGWPTGETLTKAIWLGVVVTVDVGVTTPVDEATVVVGEDGDGEGVADAVARVNGTKGSRLP